MIKNILFGILLIFIVCFLFRKKNNEETFKEFEARKVKKIKMYFNSNVWKTDSLGCLNKREPLAEYILNNRMLWSGITKEKVIDILGKPNYINKDSVYFYYTVKEFQCREYEPTMPNVFMEIYFDEKDKVMLIDEAIL